MKFPVFTVIDETACIGCGECVRVCPMRTISMKDGKAVVTGDRSLSCGHCEAICPVGAARVASLDPEAHSFKSFHFDPTALSAGEPALETLVRLMASRRSCRNFQDTPVDRVLLEDLVKVGRTAPSATNCQAWTFTVLPSRKAVAALAELVGKFYEKLNRLAEMSVLRGVMKLVGKGELAAYYRDYYEYVKQGLDDWRKFGKDRLFYGAHAAIVIGSKREAILPKEDALLASQNILLAASAMGLGTCLIGMAVEAMKNESSIKRALGIPDEETVYSVVAVGHPDEPYQIVAGRKKATVRFWGE